jgi:glycosyltransferase involved in cell wall biosynthesis
MSVVRPRPLVSVVIPCFNQAHYLPMALESVHRQTWAPIECIVVDDGSTDDTAAVALASGATIVKRQRNAGLARARNAGLAAAEGEFVVFLDSDDELVADAVESGVERLEQTPGATCIARRCALIDAEGRALPVTFPVFDNGDLYRELLHMNFVWTPGAAVFRRDAVVRIGGFPQDVSATADYAVLLALAREGGLITEPQVAVRYRKHDANMSNDPFVMLRSILTVLKRESRGLPREYADDLAEGRRRWCSFYGDQLVELLRREWRGSRRLRVLLRGSLFLVRYCRHHAQMHFWRKLRRVALRLPADAEFGQP